MRKFLNLFSYFLFCISLLFSIKSFAEVCPSGGITTSINCTGNISTTENNAYGIYLENSGGTNQTNTVHLTGNISTRGGECLRHLFA